MALETTRYHRLADDLPEPDYFEIELEKIYEPPPTRLGRIKKWVRSHVVVATLLALFLIAAALYMASWMATRPKLRGLVRPENAELKIAGPSTGNNQGSAQVDVAGSEVSGADGNDVVINNGDKDVTVEIEGVNGIGSSSNSTAALTISVTQSPTQPTTTPQASAKPDPNKASSADQGDNQVSIQDAVPEEKEPFTPIKATFYSSVEGPKSCRGHVIAAINLPKPAQPVTPTQAQCYNFPNMQASGCATFMGNKIDGCLASVYAETNCRTFMNTMAFMAENRPVGGNWRSVRVQCGLPEPDPASLGKPPGMDQISSLVDNDAPKAGG